MWQSIKEGFVGITMLVVVVGCAVFSVLSILAIIFGADNKIETWLR